MAEPCAILQVSASDSRGGAARVAWNLFDAYRRRGHDSWLVVGDKRTEDENVFLIPNDARRNPLARVCAAAARPLAPHADRSPTAKRWRRVLQRAGEPQRLFDLFRGREDFDFPATWGLTELTPRPPQIVHCHNLHGDYFDLRALPSLSKRFPLFLTLHDAWLLNGGAAHQLVQMENQQVAANRKRKAEIYRQCRLRVAAPCQWLARQIENSILTDGIVETRVIPNGVELRVFQPGDKVEAREALQIPQDRKVVLFVAERLGPTPWKDEPTLREAVSRLAQQGPLLLIGVGENNATTVTDGAETRYVGYINDAGRLALHYQAADLYLHAANVDTFPNTILEALACGTPVVATAVGGIPEQINDSQTGRLVPAHDARAMAQAAAELLRNPKLLAQMSHNAATDARQRFDLELEATAYLNWYATALETRQ